MSLDNYFYQCGILLHVALFVILSWVMVKVTVREIYLWYMDRTEGRAARLLGMTRSQYEANKHLPINQRKEP